MGGRRRSVVTLALGLLLTSCAGVDGPRWANVQPSSEAELVAESPRQTVVVTEAPDVGVLVLSGVVISDSSTVVESPGVGRVSTGDLSSGDLVTPGVPALVFTPELATENVLERDILLLEAELAAERGDETRADEIADALSEQEAAQEARAEVIAVPVRGVISGIRPDLEFDVAAGEALFTVSDPDDVVVRVTSVATQSPLAVDDRVTVASERGEQAAGQVRSVDDQGDGSRQIDVELESAIAPGQVVDVEVAVDVDGAASGTWVLTDALHRADGASYLLLQQDDGSLERVAIRIGRRTESHVEITPGPSGRQLVGAGDVLVLP